MHAAGIAQLHVCLLASVILNKKYLLSLSSDHIPALCSPHARTIANKFGVTQTRYTNAARENSFRTTLFSNGSFEPMREDCHTLPPMGSSDAPAPLVSDKDIGSNKEGGSRGISGFKRACKENKDAG